MDCDHSEFLETNAMEQPAANWQRLFRSEMVWFAEQYQDTRNNQTKQQGHKSAGIVSAPTRNSK
eukprot:5055864-Amphidinium_carterae.2